MYPYSNSYYNSGDRFVPFAGPFLLGALTGGVAIAATRPRPGYGPVYGPPVYGPPMYYGSYGYGGFTPY